MRSKVKKIFQLTAMVFTIIIMIQLLLGNELDNVIIYEYLACSLMAAMLKHTFFRGLIFESSVWKQLLYLFMVWLIVIACNFLFHWDMSRTSIYTSPALVAIIYLVLRLFNYQLEKIEVKKMNELLKRKRDNK
jgi:uncharacterized membrane protein